MEGYRNFTPSRSELRVSIRKVSNGFSVKIADSTRSEEIGKVSIAKDIDDLLLQIEDLFRGHESGTEDKSVSDF